MSLSDKQFLRQFEQLTLAEQEFSHRGHLRLAWLYLCRYDLPTAIEKTTKGIAAYANSLGATGKFHHTLTEAIVRIMYSRFQAANDENLEEYLGRNQDLVDNMWAVLHEFYSRENLFTDLAKREFVEPDLKPLPGTD